MKTFNDKNGQEWTIEITAPACKRCRDLAGFDPLSIFEGEAQAQKFYGDLVLIVDVIYAVCKPQADQRGLSSEQFGELLTGPAIEAALKALEEEAVSFSPSPRVREARGQLLKTVRAVQELGAERATKRLAEIDPAKVLDSVLPPAGVSSGNTSESPGSAPSESASAT